MWAKSFFGFGFDFAAESRWVYSCISGGGRDIEILECVRDSSISKEVCSHGECRAIQQILRIYMLQEILLVSEN